MAITIAESFIVDEGRVINNKKVDQFSKKELFISCTREAIINQSLQINGST